MATLDLRIDYMRPATPRAAVTAQAHCCKATRLGGLRARRSPSTIDLDDPLATAQAAFALTGAPLAGAPR